MDVSDEFEKKVKAGTDKYFTKSRAIVEKFGDQTVTYAVFMRRDIISAPRLALEFLEEAQKNRNFKADIDIRYPEGTHVPAKEAIMYITGPMAQLVELETQFLQNLGGPSVAAYNAHKMCMDLPDVSFIDMAARHCAGGEMVDLMSYGASVGSKTAQKEGAKGFIGNSTDRAAHFYGNEYGIGTTPHALIGYAGSTLRSAEMYHETYADQDMTILPDFFGQEITDTIAVACRFPELVEAGRLSARLDTHGGRYLEGLDEKKSIEIIQRFAPHTLNGTFNKEGLQHMIGPGVSAAAILHMREQLDQASLQKVKLVVSSGFNRDKCNAMMIAGVIPIDVIGTGSFIPSKWSETYATADIIEYDQVPRVKIGREHLLRNQP